MSPLAPLMAALMFGVIFAYESQCADGGRATCDGTPMRENILLQTERNSNAHKSSSALGSLSLLPEWAVEADTFSTQNRSFEAIPSLLEDMQDLSHDGAPTAKEWEHFKLVKALRRQGWRCPDGTTYPPNSAPFEWDCRLARAARKWSKRMATEGFEGHQYQGSTSCLRTGAEGYPAQRGCGENLALGNGSPEGALEQLKASNGHCKGMLTKEFNMMGVGYYQQPGAKYVHYWTGSFGSWHQAPDQPCIGGSPAPTPAPGCADLDTMNCQFYKSEGYCSYSPNVQRQCRETCNIDGCGVAAPSPVPPSPVPPAAPSPVPPSPVPPSVCQDADSNCQYYKTQGYCQSSENVKTYCRKSCGLCGSPSPAPPSSCQDTDPNCQYYRTRGYCQSSPNVKKHCTKTCGLCGSSPPSPSTCVDTDGACAYYRRNGYCATSENVKKHCKKTCGLCR